MTSEMQALQEERDAIALEFRSMEPLDRLNGLLPIAKETLQHLIGMVSRDAPAIAPLNALQIEFMSKVASRNYANLTAMPVRVPEGLNVPYLEYLHLLVGATEHAAQVVERLSKFTLYVAQLVNEHAFQNSSTFNHAYYAQAKQQRSLIHSQLSACFAPGSTKADSTYGDVVARQADWREVFESLNLVANQINHVNRRTLDKKIEEASHLLDLIHVKAERGELATVTGPVVMELAEGAYELASDVEYYVNIWYKINSLTEAVNQTTSRLVKVYSNQAA